jgi:hypothetical protein
MASTITLTTGATVESEMDAPDVAELLRSGKKYVNVNDAGVVVNANAVAAVSPA